MSTRKIRKRLVMHANEFIDYPQGPKVIIRFKNQALVELRGNLLADLNNEYFAVLVAKRNVTDDLCVLTVRDVYYPKPEDYKNQSGGSLRVDFDSFMRGILEDVDSRIDVDTVIDVHTHPFSHSSAWFSGIDDNDESHFTSYLEEFGIHYASIVFTQENYKARYWYIDERGRSHHVSALIRTQKASEHIGSPDDDGSTNDDSYSQDGMFNRSVLALGLDNMRKIADAQKITIVGVGGLGSIIAEHLIHMGFAKLNLIDFDTLELTNLNRVVGATYKDAENNRIKVDAIKDHLLTINPKAQIDVYPNNIFDAAVERAVADSDWVMVATDNHASRFCIQQLAFRYFVPFITAGVNITVDEGEISDISGEVILVRMGDRVCLKCLGRLNYNEIAKETHPDATVRKGLIRKGYVSGSDVKEPAVKTLNTYLATMAVDTLVNQYTERRKDPTVLVYEDNEYPTIYEDKACVEHRDMHCSVCGM